MHQLHNRSDRCNQRSRREFSPGPVHRLSPALPLKPIFSCQILFEAGSDRDLMVWGSHGRVTVTIFCEGFRNLGRNRCFK